MGFLLRDSSPDRYVPAHLDHHKNYYKNIHPDEPLVPGRPGFSFCMESFRDGPEISAKR